ncbi:hypothetical protein J4405_04420 [Candidatus Woesearchaeota archaeon]|nr:hypothetical protein [Candidatus Woesearchaeota archaeon]
MHYLNKQEYNLTFLQENIELVIYSLVCFFIPFLTHAQFLTGTIVNASLILASLNLRTYKLLPIILFPSLGVLASGLIFGNLTMFLVYMIPFIWISNFLLVIIFKKLYLHKKLNKFITLFLASLIKSLFLFTIAFTLFNLKVLPVLFLTVMGVFQFYTALAGGILAFTIQYIKKEKN